MQYMLLIHSDEAGMQATSQEDIGRMVAAYGACTQTCVRGLEADGRNFIGLSITCDRQIRGVCLSRGDGLGRLFDSEDLLRH
jgi:hypothetical protein